MQQLIDGIKNNNRKAQEQLYKKFADKMFFICFRYVWNEDDAAEILNSAFHKAFANIQSFTMHNNNAFECWLRKIMVNESLMFLRQRKQLKEMNSLSEALITSTSISDYHFHENDYMALLQKLPAGYRAVFNLYAIEGYNHQEISEMLDITESTSRSQLCRAREMLKSLINKEI